MNVIITGVSSGIGAELVSLFENDPAIECIYACSSSIDVISVKGKVTNIPLDFKQKGAVDQLLKYLSGCAVNILINNAGYLECVPFAETSSETLRDTLKVNFEGPFFLIQSLLPNLISGQAHIVNIGSMGGYQGSGKFPGLLAYSSSKAALANLTECLAEELKAEKVTVNCLALGAVQTKMLEKAFPNYRAKVNSKEMASFIKNFSIHSTGVINGKVIPVSLDTP